MDFQASCNLVTCITALTDPEDKKSAIPFPRRRRSLKRTCARGLWIDGPNDEKCKITKRTLLSHVKPVIYYFQCERLSAPRVMSNCEEDQHLGRFLIPFFWSV